MTTPGTPPPPPEYPPPGTPGLPAAQHGQDNTADSPTQSSDDRSVLSVIRDIQQSALDPRSLGVEDRRRCVEHLTGEGYSLAEIAEILKVTERTIARDRSAVRQSNAIERDEDITGEMVGQLVKQADTTINRIRRVTRDSDTPPASRIEGEKACWVIARDLIQKLQSLGYLPNAPQEIRGRMIDGLGYRRFGAQGGDWGGMVSSRLGFDFPGNVLGVHVNLVTGVPDYRAPGQRELSPAEREFLQQSRHWFETEGGYFHLQRTKPQTLSYGLNDSPAGLAAWIVEKFRTWSDCGGDVESSFTKDELLTNITIYWVTQTIGSSANHYFENRTEPWRFEVGQRVEVPCGVALFPAEINRPPREWAERTHNVQRWTEMPRGGHFAALEEPQLLAEDIRAFFRPLRQP